MKRSHRRWHRLAWAVLTPTVLLVLAAAWMLRAAEPVNTTLPAALVATPAAQGA